MHQKCAGRRAASGHSVRSPEVPAYEQDCETRAATTRKPTMGSGREGLCQRIGLHRPNGPPLTMITTAASTSTARYRLGELLHPPATLRISPQRPFCLHRADMSRARAPLTVTGTRARKIDGSFMGSAARRTTRSAWCRTDCRQGSRAARASPSRSGDTEPDGPRTPGRPACCRWTDRAHAASCGRTSPSACDHIPCRRFF